MAYSVKYATYLPVWFVAADLEGPGMEGYGPVALWLGLAESADETEFENIGSLNDVAMEHTGFVTGEHLEDYQIEELVEEGQEAVSCVDRAFNPVSPGTWVSYYPIGYSLVVGHDLDDVSCVVLLFQPVNGTGPEYAAGYWPAGQGEVTTFSRCDLAVLPDNFDLPPLILESLPPEYRHLVDSELVFDGPPPTPAAGTVECERLTERNLDVLESLIDQPSVSIRASVGVAMYGAPTFFVADLEGPGLEGDGPFAVWATDSHNSTNIPRVRAEELLAADEITAQYSTAEVFAEQPELHRTLTGYDLGIRCSQMRLDGRL